MPKSGSTIGIIGLNFGSIRWRKHFRTIDWLKTLTTVRVFDSSTSGNRRSCLMESVLRNGLGWSILVNLPGVDVSPFHHHRSRSQQTKTSTPPYAFDIPQRRYSNHDTASTTRGFFILGQFTSALFNHVNSRSIIVNLRRDSYIVSPRSLPVWILSNESLIQNSN